MTKKKKMANWAAKTANLLRDEMGAGPGTPGGGAAARALADRRGVVRDLVDRRGGVVERWFGPSCRRGAVYPGTARRGRRCGHRAARSPCCRSTRSAKPPRILPIGVTDYATAVRVHGDQIVPERIPGPALAGRTVAEVLEAAGCRGGTGFHRSADRVLSTASWDTLDELIENLVAVFAAGASLVQVANPDPAPRSGVAVTEKVTRG